MRVNGLAAECRTKEESKCRGNVHEGGYEVPKYELRASCKTLSKPVTRRLGDLINFAKIDIRPTTGQERKSDKVDFKTNETSGRVGQGDEKTGTG